MLSNRCVCLCIMFLYILYVKNAPNLASCSFDKKGLILIIFSKQHQHTFKNDLFAQLSLYLHFHLLYVPLNSSDGSDAKRKIFRGRLLMALKRAGCIRWFFFFSGLHHYECVAPLVANSLQSGRFWARSTTSVHDSPWESRSLCTVFIQVIRGRPGGLFQYTEGEEVKICFASTLSTLHVPFGRYDRTGTG